MDTVWIVILVSSATAAIAGGGVWVWWARRAADWTKRFMAKEQEAFDLRLKLTQAEIRMTEREQAGAERLKDYQETQQEMEQRFKNLTNSALAESMERSQKMIAELASRAFQSQSEAASASLGEKYQRIESLMKPLTTALTSLTAGQQSSTEILSKQIENLLSSQKSVAEATSSLRVALQTPAIAGKFGEGSLKGLLDAVGLVEGNQYQVKPVVLDPDTNADLEPDVVVKFPDNYSVAIDSKLPMKSYLAYCDATKEKERTAALDAHVKAVKNHIRELGGKGYDRALSKVGFTILYCANEGAFLAALHADPELHTQAIQKRIFLASPTTMLFILYWLNNMWRNHEAAENVTAIREVAVALMAALSDFFGSFQKVGVSLKNVLIAFNHSTEVLSDKVIQHARDLVGLGIETPKPLKEVKRVRGKVAELEAGE